MLKGLKSYQPSKYKCSDFLSKTHVTFLLWLITFEPLEQKQSYIPLLKVLMCGMNARGAQQHAGIFILWYTSLKMALLLHKTALVNFPMATIVHIIFAKRNGISQPPFFKIMITKGVLMMKTKVWIKRETCSNIGKYVLQISEWYLKR